MLLDAAAAAGERHAAAWPTPEARPRFVGLAVLAATGPLATLLVGAALQLPGRFNDFASYWLAGRLVDAGLSPYDLTALAATGRREGVQFLLGTGYSYPPPLAVAMVPLARLPFEAAAWLFSALSVVAFAVAAAAWIGTLGQSGRRSALLAFGAGVYPPVSGSAFFGQANLLAVAALALGLWLVLRSASPVRNVVGGLVLGLVAAVKVVPLVLALPLAVAPRPGRRLAAAVALVAGFAGGIASAIALAPVSGRGGEGLLVLLTSDGFWSNQSLNGLATRLVQPTERTEPLVPGIDPVLLGLILLIGLALATLGLLVVAWRARGPSEPHTSPGPVESAPAVLRAALAVTLIAALAGAPKDSFWNHAPALLAVGLLPEAALTGRGSRDRWLLALWYGAAWLQVVLDQTGGALTRPLGGPGSVLSSAALLGLLCLWAWAARRLLEAVASAAARCASRTVSVEMSGG